MLYFDYLVCCLLCKCKLFKCSRLITCSSLGEERAVFSAIDY